MKRLRVALLHPVQAAYSETFIRDHIAHLPAEVIARANSVPARRDGTGGLLPPLSFATYKGLRLLAQRAPPVAARQAAHAADTHFTRALLRLLRTERPAVLLAEFGPMGVLVQDACAATQTPLVVHFHGKDAYHYPTLRAYEAGYRRLFAQAHTIIGGSQAMLAQLAALGAPAAKLAYNPSGAPQASAAPQATPATAPPLFVAVGRFVEKKAPHLTLLAFRRVLAACPAARLVMLGTGPLWQPCRALVDELGIAASVELRGARPHAEVLATLREARAFVQHSLRATDGDAEGTAITPLEASMAGLPVVSTRHGGIRESVREGITGFLVDEGDLFGMARAMLRLAREPALAHEMGLAGHKHAQSHFTQEQVIGNLYTLLERAAHTEART